MNPTIPHPTDKTIGHVMTVDAFVKPFHAGVFLQSEVAAFWGNDTHYDPLMSVFTIPQPPVATKVAILLAGMSNDSSINPPSETVT